MLNLSQIESDLTDAIKSRNPVSVDTLRGLKTRIQNEKIAKQKDLEESDVLALIRNEVKRRRESATAFEQGGRKELAEKELLEVEVLQKYLPPEMSEEQISTKVEEIMAGGEYSEKDFGQLMGKLKAALPEADGAVLAKILKEKLK
jgi:uncharacterized protein YqeY